jgi:colicin import membrane protein
MNQTLDLVLTESKLELSEAETIKQSYLPYFEQMAEIKTQSAKIDWENPTEIDEKIARELRLKTVKIRTGSETVKDDRKKIHMLKANVEQSAWNLIKSECQLIEEKFIQVEKKREIAEKARIAQLQTERNAEAAQYAEFIPQGLNLGAILEDDYNKLIEGAKLQQKAKEDRLAKEEEERIEAAKKLEEERIERERIAAEEKAKIEAENARLKAEAEAKEKQLAAERAEAAKKQAEIEAKAKAERQSAEKKAAEEKAKQDAILKAEREAKAKVEAELKAKQEAESKAKADKEAAAEAALAAPDKDKLVALGKQLTALAMPEVKSKKAQKIVDELKANLDASIAKFRLDFTNQYKQ